MTNQQRKFSISLEGDENKQSPQVRALGLVDIPIPVKPFDLKLKKHIVSART